MAIKREGKNTILIRATKSCMAQHCKAVNVIAFMKITRNILAEINLQQELTFGIDIFVNNNGLEKILYFTTLWCTVI